MRVSACMNFFPRLIVKTKGTEIAEKYIADNPRLSYETLHDMSDEVIESILKMYLKDDIKCHVSEFRHCIQEHLYERFHKLENDIERLYEILYDFKGDDESKKDHKRVLQYLLELKLHWKNLK